MKAYIIGDSIRDDGDFMRFLVRFPVPELNTSGNYGVQVGLPTTEDDIKNAVKNRYVEVQTAIQGTNDLKNTYESIIDKEIELM